MLFATITPHQFEPTLALPLGMIIVPCAASVIEMDLVVILSAADES